MNSIGERLYELRKNKNLSQGDLADKLDVSRQTVSKWENNMCLPEVEKLIQLSEVFGVSTDYILIGEEKEQKPVYIYVKDPEGENKKKNNEKIVRKNIGIVLATLGGLSTIPLVLMGFILPAVVTGFIAVLGIFLAFGGKHPWLIISWVTYIVTMCCLLPFGPLSPIIVFVPDFYGLSTVHFLLLAYAEWAFLGVLIAYTVKIKRGYVLKRKDK